MESYSHLHVLFVDDEPQVLNGLRRSLHGLRRRWDLRFASGGQQALYELATGPVDVVVCDMRMPEMDGAEVLHHVREHYPNVVRLALSGQADQNLLLKAGGSIHNYLCKPCDAETLEAAIVQTVRAHGLLHNEAVLEVVRSIRVIPSLPRVLQLLFEELRRPDPNLNHIGDLVSQDPGLTAQLLRLINSPFFAISQPVTNVTTAVTLLGVQTVAAALITHQLFSTADERTLARLGLSGLFAHSTLTSRLAVKVARLFAGNSRMAAAAGAAGLLHDVGKLVLATNLTERYTRVADRVAGGEGSTREAELDIIGAPHDWVAGHLLYIWGLPVDIVDAVAFHHDPRHGGNRSVGPVAAVHLANAAAHARPGTPWPPPWLDTEFLEDIGWNVTPETWEDLCHHVE